MVSTKMWYINDLVDRVYARYRMTMEGIDDLLPWRQGGQHLLGQAVTGYTLSLRRR